MDSQEFLQAYSPSNQYVYALHEQRCHRGKAPTIMQCVATQGIDVTIQAINALVEDFIKFTPARSRMSVDQRKQLSYVIITQFKTLRITQLILFFVKAKAGYFGKFYTQIEPMDITIALRQWQEVCDKELAEYYYERARTMHEDDLELTREYEDELRDKYETVLINSQFVLQL